MLEKLKPEWMDYIVTSMFAVNCSGWSHMDTLKTALPKNSL